MLNGLPLTHIMNGFRETYDLHNDFAQIELGVTVIISVELLLFYKA